MALIRLGSLIGSITGSLGTITFKNTRYGPLATKRLGRTKHRSQAQQASDSRWVTLTRAWRNLTVPQRIAWHHTASQIPTTNPLGVTRTHSGFSLFTRHVSPAYLAAIPLPSDPPNHSPSPELAQASARFNVASTYRLICLIASDLDPVYLLTYGSRPLVPPPIDPADDKTFPPLYYFQHWRFLAITSYSPGVQTEIVTAPFTSAFGICQKGEVVALRAFLWHPSALQSSVSTAPCWVQA